jgi:uncharacterized Fe-S cluster-containing protein
MTNNKQQTAVEWGVEKLASLTFDYIAGFMNKSEYDELSKGIIREAKEMEIAGKEMSYSDGYAEGYKRELELTKWAISNLIPPHNEQQ